MSPTTHTVPAPALPDAADDVTRYAELQRRVYDQHSGDRAGAEGMVASDYSARREQARFQAEWIMNEYLRRRPEPSAPVDFDVSVLDFGCGVGRVMEAVAELGFTNVDGVDISARMLEHAAASPLLAESRFWVTSGHDCGDAPAATYDVAYSLICLNHVSMRQTRIDIFRSIARCLKPGGVGVFEFFNYPSIDAARIPLAHVPWRANRPSPGTNSEADVWVTPDQFGEVYTDVRLAFRDICLQEVEVWDNPAIPTEDPRYPVRRNVLLVSGSTERRLVDHYWGERPEQAF